MTYSSQAISMHQGKKKLYFLLETESSTPHEWEGCFHVTNLITASENKQQNDCFCCLSKLSANNNLRWFRRTQMKERITKRRGKIVQTLSTLFFFGKSKLSQPVLINIIENDSPCPQHRPVCFLQGWNVVTWTLSIPAWSQGSVPLEVYTRTQKKYFAWPFK